MRTLIRNAAIFDGTGSDPVLGSVAVEGDRIVAVELGADAIPAAPGDNVIDGEGLILMPGLVEAHTHVDKTLLGMGWHPHTAGPRLRFSSLN